MGREGSRPERERKGGEMIEGKEKGKEEKGKKVEENEAEQ